MCFAGLIVGTMNSVDIRTCDWSIYLQQHQVFLTNGTSIRCQQMSPKTTINTNPPRWSTLPPERTQPQKLCTANFSSGTLKTLINRLLRLKNKIFWRDPCEKKPFFSRLKSDSQKYILKWSYWPEILAPGLKSIFVTTLFSNFFHFTQPLHLSPILPLVS